MVRLEISFRYETSHFARSIMIGRGNVCQGGFDFPSLVLCQVEVRKRSVHIAVRVSGDAEHNSIAEDRRGAGGGAQAVILRGFAKLIAEGMRQRAQRQRPADAAMAGEFMSGTAMTC